MAQDLLDTDFFDGIDFIVPVPLHRKKMRQRGYNQSAELAHGIAELTGLPVREDLVSRVVDTPTQTRLTAEERRENVRDAFRLLQPAAVANRHILLVDDVLTTNATILSCAEELVKATGVRISVLTLALAGQHPTGGHEFRAWWHEATPTGCRETTSDSQKTGSGAEDPRSGLENSRSSAGEAGSHAGEA